ISGDYPDWLDPAFARTFGEERCHELAALARRAPIDLRVNTLKVERERVATALRSLHPIPTRWSSVGLRISVAAEARNPAIHAEPPYIKGQIELQDEGSQLSAQLTRAQPGE